MTKAVGATILAAAVAGAWSLSAQAPAERPFPPIDEASHDPTFLAFRARFLDIVERRDLTALMSVTSPTIMYSFGEGPGMAGFRNYYGLDGDTSELWAELKQVLSLGGTFQGPDIFVAPYVYSRWPSEIASDDIDYVAVVRDGTPVYAAPRPDAPVLRRFGPSIVLTEYDVDLVGRWYRVLMMDGQPGYIEHRHARRPTDIRAIFARLPAGWQMVICIGGD